MIRRGPRPADKFTIVSNAALEDETLTWRARGVLAYLLGRPEGWSTSAERLSGMSPKGKEGRDTLRSVLAELEAAGYVRREKVQDARGRWSTTLVVYDETMQQDSADEPSRKAAEPPNVEDSKNSGSPGVGEPAVGSPAVGKPGPINKKETKKDSKKESSSPPRSVAPLPPSSGDDLPRKRYSGWFPTDAETKQVMDKLKRFPGPEYVNMAAGRWSPTMEDAWFLTCEYIEFVQGKEGWHYSPDGWLKYIEGRMTERANRPRAAYAENGVPM